MTPGDYIFTGGYFLGAAVFLVLHHSNKRAREKQRAEALAAMNPVDQFLFHVRKLGGELDPEKLRYWRDHCNELVDATPLDAETKNAPLLLADHSKASAGVHTASDDLAATRPPGDQQASASASAVADGVEKSTPSGSNKTGQENA